MVHDVEIRGLRLILGGEIRAVPKLADRESAVVLVRGPAGSGKTLFASHLAAYEALARGGDVVYCCIELLPSELDAQLSGLTFGPERRSLRVGNLDGAPAELKPRMFAAIFDVPEVPEPDIGAEIQRVIEEAGEQGATPSVVVIDSLTDGYRLGMSTPRLLADALAKFAAEQGMLVILLEEVVDQRDSVWTFVADIVLELAHHGAVGTSAAEDRALTVRKNRFGPAHVGPHAFAIHQATGIEIYPRLGTYLSEPARSLLPRPVQKTTPSWGFYGPSGNVGVPKRGEVVLVTGNDPTLLSVALNRIVARAPSLRLDMASAAPSEAKILRWGNPVLGPERVLAELCGKLDELADAISGLVMGDLAAINHNIDPEGLRRALPVVIMIAQAAGLPVALFETTGSGTALSSYLHLADTFVQVTARPRPVPAGHGQQHRIIGLLSSRSRDISGLEIEIHP